MSRTLLALLVPEAEPLVADMRARLDPAAKLGLGAHVTLVYPFYDTGDLTSAHHDALRGVAARHPPLSFSLRRIGTFPSTVWLAPDPDAPMIALATALDRAFPGRPATGRSFQQFVPHLSVARNLRRGADVDAVVGELRERIEDREVSCRCAEVHIMARLEPGWRPIGHAPLGR